MMDMLKEKEGWKAESDDRLRAFCARKWNCDFSEEMSRSVKAMLDAWTEGPQMLR